MLVILFILVRLVRQGLRREAQAEKRREGGNRTGMKGKRRVEKGGEGKRATTHSFLPWPPCTSQDSFRRDKFREGKSLDRRRENGNEGERRQGEYAQLSARGHPAPR